MRIPYICVKTALGGNVPEPKELARHLTMRSFEIEGVEGDGDEAILEADILPNRQHDCLGLRYVIGEVAAITGAPVPADDFPTLPEGAAPSVAVSVEDPRCRRYILVEAANVSAAPSPAWLVEKCAQAGQRSINGVVDATNFVLHLENQPTHAFDADKVSGAIRVRGSLAGERMMTLDGKDVALDDGTLVIADDAGPLAIAGVKGGNRAGVTASTTRVYLESANFEPRAVRRAAQRYDLRTDSSKRFECEIAPELAERGMARLVETLRGLSPDATFSGALDHWPRRAHPYKTGVSAREASSLLGREVTLAEARRALELVGCATEEIADPGARVLEVAAAAVGKPYRYGASVLYDAPESFDCSSLVAYACAEAGLSAPRMSVDQYAWSRPIEAADLRPGDLVFSCIDGVGPAVHREPQTKTMEYAKGTAVPEPGIDHCGVYAGEGEIIHATERGGGLVKREKLAESAQFQTVVGYGRVTLADEPRLVATVPAERLDLRAPEDLVEEIGRLGNLEELAAVALSDAGQGAASGEFAVARAIRAALVAEGFYEIMTSSFSADGELEVLKPANAEKPMLRPALGGSVAAALRVALTHRDWIAAPVAKVFEIGRAFVVRDGKPAESLRLSVGAAATKAAEAEVAVASSRPVIERALGALAEAEPAARESVTGAVAGAIAVDTFSLDGAAPVAATAPLAPLAASHRFTPISPYPYAARDVAVWVPGEGGQEAEVAETIRAAAGELLTRLYKFDEFTKRKEGEPVRTSYAFRLILQSRERTLADAEIAAATDAAYAALRAKGWEIR